MMGLQESLTEAEGDFEKRLNLCKEGSKKYLLLEQIERTKKPSCGPE